MERSYDDQIPTRHTLTRATERHLSQISFKSADRAVNASAALGFELSEEEAQDLKLAVADAVEKVLRAKRRGE